MSAPATMADTCPVCGGPLGVSAPGACARCPISAGGCAVACCPRCGYATPTPEGSALVRLFDRIASRIPTWRTSP